MNTITSNRPASQKGSKKIGIQVDLFLMLERNPHLQLKGQEERCQ